MHRFFADPETSDENLFRLSDAEAHHALKVLRLRDGDAAEAIYRGARYLVRLEILSSGEPVLIPLENLPSTEPRLSVTLFQGLPKGDKMDLIVQKSVEIGIGRIVPVLFSRCVARPDEKESMKKTQRWQRISLEAAKQSGRCVIPEVIPPVSLSSLPEHISGCEAVAVPWEECEHGGPQAFVRSHPSLSALGIVIGPEGGISGDEADMLRSIGCETVTLGKRILRTETAGIAALSVFFGLYGEME